MKVTKLTLFLLVLLTSLSADEVKFDTLEISGKKLKNDELPYITPGAVSSRNDILTATQSIDSIIRSIPGAYTQVDQSQGTVSVNIRSMTGLGRVNTMVDGVTQTFFGTSTDSKGFHFAGNLATSAFGAMIDPNFLTGVDVERGTFSGGHGGLMGSANFRTIGVDDVISNGNNFGFLGKYSYGSNRIGPSYMGSVASKFSTENGGSYGVLFGYSGKKTRQDYKTGNGTRINETAGSVAFMGKKQLTQSPKSWLFKFEAMPDEANKATLTYRKYSTYLANRDMDSDTYQLDYRFNPDNNFIDINLLAAYNLIEQVYDKDASIGWGKFDKGMKLQNKATTFDLSNTMKFSLLDVDLTTAFGVNYLSNKYDRITDDADYNRLYTGYSVPKGKQTSKTYYLNNTFDYGIFSLGANFALLDWEVSGIKGPCAKSNPYCPQKTAGNFSKSEDSLNYSFILSANIDELFSPFASYTKATRGLNVQEMFHSGSVYDDINTLLKPETAKTWQVGFNSFKHGLINQDDVFGFKLTYFNTRIKDFIYDQTYIFQNPDPTLFALRMNDKAKLSGIEMELKYDMGVFYTNLSYTHQKAKYKQSDSMILDWGAGPSSGYTQFSLLPKDSATLDIGTRLLDKKLTLGSLIKYTGKATRVNPTVKFTKQQNGKFKKDTIAQDIPKIPTIVDLYAMYSPLKGLDIKFEVQNVANKNYMDALYTYNSSSVTDVLNNDITLFNNAARGRSYLVSFSYRY
ncbi:TonB-dependent receptor domain-containing protein [Campylobacter geochelonis]|uniref:TonB-dependent outer membrane receptor n=1 Tax=Campylobacter geochelonis TaxID=1780362 RepID=A0A128EA12_9BACT|nr:TonB-dependent receptor [Campylobacter geochelonis]QKF70667.1 TonB-dependent heme/hemoglobin receptor family protein [Campylobacter geochelonis]CZE45824.1 TonB-dependent outer membrane receptor [Campylobacter geochelonis]